MATPESLEAFRVEFDTFMKDLAGLTEQTAGIAETIQKIGDGVAKDAEMIAIKRVDPATIGEAEDLSRVLYAASSRACILGSRCSDTMRQVQAADDQLQASHSGIEEAARTSSVDVTDIDPSWFQAQ